MNKCTFLFRMMLFVFCASQTDTASGKTHKA